MGYGNTTGGSVGENISHFTGVRMRIVGTGDLKMRFLTVGEEETQTLVPFTMSNSSREPFRLANFIQQRAVFEGKTTEIGDYFRINRIVLFAKELWTDYPSGD